MRIWTTIDKSSWGPGPWQGEPDKIVWVDPATDLDCMIRRAPHHGALCGYVGVDEHHPWHGADSLDGRLAEVSVRDGITYAAPCADGADEATDICHVVAPGRPEHVWWFGFACHSWRDIAPALDRRLREVVDSYGKDLASYKAVPFVREEVRLLAHQLAMALNEGPRTGSDSASITPRADVIDIVKYGREVPY